MSRRFFVEPPVGDRQHVVLADSEAHHLLHVMRAQVGDEVSLFDGSGWEFSALVTAVGRKQAELRITGRTEANRELGFALELFVALPRGDRQEWLVEKTVELGVTRVVPVITERGVAQPTEKACERLRRAVIEASKQCGRNRLMQIASPVSLAQIAAEAANDKTMRLFAHPGRTGPNLSQRLSTVASSSSTVRILIGPEGGLTNTEVAELSDHGWTGVDLGARILRVETAALALAAFAMLQSP
jgi:16S rRNA (uracil1498-N3)-methyltransferase